MKTKFLIIRLSSIGDIVLTTPVIRCLKKQFGNAEIHYLVKQKHRAVIENNPYIDKIHDYKGKTGEIAEQLQNENFDYIIDLHNNLRSTLIKNKLGKPSFSFNKLNFSKFLLTHLKINRLPQLHIVDRYMETVSSFGVCNDGQGLDFFIPDHITIPESATITPGEKYVAFVIGGTYFTKRLPSAKVVEICNSIPHKVILLGGKNEKTEAQLIASQTGHNVVNMVGTLSLFQSAIVVKSAFLVLANDTGLMHIAAAYKKKILSFWGNTVPVFGMYPYLAHPDSKIMEVENLNCRPCSKIGYKKCPRGHFNCMNQIETSTAIEWITRSFE